LGASLAGEKKYAEGEPLLLEGYHGMLARKDRIAVPDHYHLDRAHEWLVDPWQTYDTETARPSGLFPGSDDSEVVSTVKRPPFSEWIPSI
jgi:hypothetical protein